MAHSSCARFASECSCWLCQEKFPAPFDLSRARRVGKSPSLRTRRLKARPGCPGLWCPLRSSVLTCGNATRKLSSSCRYLPGRACRHGVRLGYRAYRTPGLAAVTGQPRYRELARRYGPVVAQAGTCACHVHVGVPSRDLGVQVLARLRPWLAPLLAITANSPIADGHDTGWASWRYLLWSRWPDAATELARRGHRCGFLVAAQLPPPGMMPRLAADPGDEQPGQPADAYRSCVLAPSSLREAPGRLKGGDHPTRVRGS